MGSFLTTDGPAATGAIMSALEPESMMLSHRMSYPQCSLSTDYKSSHTLVYDMHLQYYHFVIFSELNRLGEGDKAHQIGT